MKRRNIVRLAPVAIGAASLVAAAGMSGTASAAATVTASVKDDTLSVTGTNAGEVLSLVLAPNAPGTLDVDLGNDGTADFSFDRSTFSRIDVSLRGGDDQFRVNQGDGTFTDEAITVDGGTGNDTMIGGSGNETFIGGSGDDFVDGNIGSDVAQLGSGRDRFEWDPGDGSDTVDGGSDVDTLDFNGSNISETMDLSANGSRVRFFRDVAGITMDMSGIEQFDLRTRGGSDTVTVNDLSGTGLRPNIDLTSITGTGDSAADTVIVNGTPNADRVNIDTDAGQVVVHGRGATETHISGSEAFDKVQLDTLDGNDKVSVDGTVFAVIGIGVDLGAGQL